MRAPLALGLLLVQPPLRTARPIADSTLGLSEVAWAPSFTHRSEGPLAGCSATGPVAGSQCLGPSFYLGTPSVVRSPTSGNLLVAADLFDHGPSAECWPNFFVAHRVPGWEWERNATLFQSQDNGSTWEFRAWVPKHYWSSLFSHEGAVYYMGVSDDKAGGVKLSRSTVRPTCHHPTTHLPSVSRQLPRQDDGLSWSGTIIRDDMRYTTGATAVLFAQGRVWRALEGGPGRASMMFSAPVAQMLDAKAWRRTTPLPFDTKWVSTFAPQLSSQPSFTQAPKPLLYRSRSRSGRW